MNCQEFRRLWQHDATDADLTHIETCNDCLNWLEANFTSDEEVMFMKEYPQPSAHLEDRIMQAVYQLAVPSSSSPVSATMEKAPGAMARSPRRYLSIGWAGAAAILLAVGLISLRGMPGDFQESAGFVPQKQSAASETATVSQPQVTVSNNTEVQEAAKPPKPENQTVQQPAAPAEKAMALQPVQSVPSAQPRAEMGQPASQPSMEKVAITAPAVAGPPVDTGKSIAARYNRAGSSNNTNQESSQPAAKQAAPAGETGQIAVADVAAPKHQGSSMPGIAGLAAQSAPDTAPPDTKMDAAATKATPQITLSTFTDVETAVRSSDLPIPSITNLPDGFALSSVSLRYESETSQRVTNISLMYHRNADSIKIEATRSSSGPHSLSVPGIFSETQVFQVEGERAIGVTYAQQEAATSGANAQHAVHFYATKYDQTLYVVLTANGISLSELTELAKHLAWTNQ
jgi:hypothetical protein